jgi:hypothetical protein
MHTGETKGSHTAAFCLLANTKQDAITLFHFAKRVFGSIGWQGNSLINVYHS